MFFNKYNKKNIDLEVWLHQNEVSIFLFFFIIDSIIYGLLVCFFGIIKILNLNLILYFIIGIDIILRSSYIILSLYFDLVIIKEILVSLFTTFQIFGIFYFFEQLFSFKSVNISAKNLKIKNRYLAFFIIYSFIFIYKTHYSSYLKFIYGLSFLINIVILYLLYKYISKRIIIYFSQIKNNIKEKKKCSCFHMTETFIISPFRLCLIFYILYYYLMFLSLFIDHKMFLHIIIPLCIIPKEIGKYLCFIVLIAMYYSFEQYLLKDIEAIANEYNIINKNVMKNEEENYKKNIEDIDNDKAALK